MHLDIDEELRVFKDEITSSNKADLLTLLYEVCNESHKHLDTMARDFLETGVAYYDDSIYMKVIKRKVI